MQATVSHISGLNKLSRPLRQREGGTLIHFTASTPGREVSTVYRSQAVSSSQPNGNPKDETRSDFPSQTSGSCHPSSDHVAGLPRLRGIRSWERRQKDFIIARCPGAHRANAITNNTMQVEINYHHVSCAWSEFSSSLQAVAHHSTEECFPPPQTASIVATCGPL